MTKGEVLRILGTPDRAEAFRMGTRECSIWIFCSRKGNSDRVVWFGPDHKVRMIASESAEGTTPAPSPPLAPRVRGDSWESGMPANS